MLTVIREALVDYAANHRSRGSFVMAVLANDLREAVCRADDTNLKDLREIVLFVFNELPGPCHGSKEAVAKWLAEPVTTPLPDLQREGWNDQ